MAVIDSDVNHVMAMIDSDVLAAIDSARTVTIESDVMATMVDGNVLAMANLEPKTVEVLWWATEVLVEADLVSVVEVRTMDGQKSIVKLQKE